MPPALATPKAAASGAILLPPLFRESGKKLILQTQLCPKTSEITQAIIYCPDLFKFIKPQSESPQLWAEIMQLDHGKMNL